MYFISHFLIFGIESFRIIKCRFSNYNNKCEWHEIKEKKMFLIIYESNTKENLNKYLVLTVYNCVYLFIYSHILFLLY